MKNQNHLFGKNKLWAKSAGVMTALMLAVLAVPGTAEAATKTGILDGVAYTVGAACNFQYGTGYGRYADVRKTMTVRAVFCYETPDGQSKSASRQSKG